MQINKNARLNTSSLQLVIELVKKEGKPSADRIISAGQVLITEMDK